jgi:hypothetical protein
MTRKQTIDDIDDVDDEDGSLERDRRRRTDMDLRTTRDPGLGLGDEGYLNEGRDDVDYNPKTDPELKRKRGR